MHEHRIACALGLTVSATETGDIVLEQLSSDASGRAEPIRIPHDRVHQVTVWMRRLAAEFDGLSIPSDTASGRTLPTVI